MQRVAGKELALAPLQDWGEETEDGAVYSVSLRRQRSQRLSPGERSGGSQARSSAAAAEAFVHYRTSKVRALRAARLERLVCELASGDREQDPGFVPAFLATHRAFAPTARVLGLLLPPPPPPPPPPRCDRWPPPTAPPAPPCALGSPHRVLLLFYHLSFSLMLHSKNIRGPHRPPPPSSLHFFHIYNLFHH
ncbi:ral guanine nucleotide dissociation stimulator-like 3, partial [Dasypus novemcinctus]|uniref:ral guanine nucleotide dissociation stimulator-like 3 n=1 Tax=Dasypus novemcinctus TaxID=9361 RepID=UPI00265DE0F9